MIAAAPQGAAQNPAYTSSPPLHFLIRFLHKLLVVLWASPWSAVGLAIGALGLVTGGHVQARCGVLEFYGGAVTKLLECMPIHPIAVTLGHVVLGRVAAGLDVCRTHELVHVRQYERWGPLFIPAYLACSLVIWLRGGDAYRDNPFEREAYAVAP
jgi:hypothetical protein